MSHWRDTGETVPSGRCDDCDASVWHLRVLVHDDGCKTELCERCRDQYILQQGKSAIIAQASPCPNCEAHAALVDMMRRREQPYIEQWRAETGRHDTLPDYGDMLDWMAGKIEAAAREREQTKQTTDEVFETLNMRIVACSIAALSNTEDSAKRQRLPEGSPYWTPAYEDVCKAVDREMAHRESLKSLRAGILRVIDDYPRDIKQDAEEALRALLAETEGKK